MNRIVLACLALSALATAAAAQAPSLTPPQPPPLPRVPPVPYGNVLGGDTNADPYGRYWHDYLYWSTRYPYLPPWMYPYGGGGGSPYANPYSATNPYGPPSSSNPYAPPGQGGNVYTPGKSPASAPSESASRDNRATIHVHLPSSVANVWVDDHKMQDKLDTERVFVSPPLEPGNTYRYTVKAHWVRRGENVIESRQVAVRPNQQATVDFTKPAKK